MRCLAFTMAFALLSATEAFADADQCRDILIYAAKNQNQSLSVSNMSSDIKNALCNGSSITNNSTSKLGGGINVFGFGSGGFDQARQNLQAVQNQSCSSGSSQLSKDQFDKVVSDLVDHDSVEAWNKCMTHGGLVGTIERNGSAVIFHLQWVAAYGVDRTKITDTQVDGVSCQSLWPGGTAVSSVKLQKQCKGDPKVAVSATIQAENDSVTLSAPAVAALQALPPDNRSRKEKCFDDNADECVLLVDEIKRNCDERFPQTSMKGKADWRMCVQPSNELNDLASSTKQMKAACAAAPEGQKCHEAKQTQEQIKAQLAGGPGPSLPPFPVGPPPKR